MSRKPHYIQDEAEELAQSWINGNRDHVKSELFSRKDGVALAAGVCMVLVEQSHNATAFCDRLAIHAFTQ